MYIYTPYIRNCLFIVQEGPICRAREIYIIYIYTHINIRGDLLDACPPLLSFKRTQGIPGTHIAYIYITYIYFVYIYITSIIGLLDARPWVLASPRQRMARSCS
jgi:hypothetical protein